MKKIILGLLFLSSTLFSLDWVKDINTALTIAKKEHKTIIKSIAKAEIGEVIIYDDKTILEKFDKFCKEEEYDNIEYGKKILNLKLKQNG